MASRDHEYPSANESPLRQRMVLNRHSRGNWLTVADEVIRILVARAGIIMRAHPIVITMIARLRIVWVVELLLGVEMPLADMAGRITRLLK